MINQKLNLPRTIFVADVCSIYELVIWNYLSNMVVYWFLLCILPIYWAVGTGLLDFRMVQFYLCFGASVAAAAGADRLDSWLAGYLFSCLLVCLFVYLLAGSYFCFSLCLLSINFVSPWHVLHIYMFHRSVVNCYCCCSCFFFLLLFSHSAGPTKFNSYALTIRLRRIYTISIFYAFQTNRQWMF